MFFCSGILNLVINDNLTSSYAGRCELTQQTYEWLQIYSNYITATLQMFFFTDNRTQWNNSTAADGFRKLNTH